MTLRHCSKSERSAFHRVVGAMETCQVKLTPALVLSSVQFIDTLPGSNYVDLPLPIPDLPTSTRTPQPMLSSMLDSTSVPPTR